MNTPSIVIAIEHASLWGNLPNQSKEDQFKFMQDDINQWTTTSAADCITGTHTTLGILEQVLFYVIDQNEKEIGTWTKRFEEGKYVEREGLWGQQLTVNKDQLSTAFTHIFFNSRIYGK